MNMLLFKKQRLRKRFIITIYERENKLLPIISSNVLMQSWGYNLRKIGVCCLNYFAGTH